MRYKVTLTCRGLPKFKCSHPYVPGVTQIQVRFNSYLPVKYSSFYFFEVALRDFRPILESVEVASL